MLSDYENSIESSLGLIPVPFAKALNGQEGVTTETLGGVDDPRPQSQGGYDPGVRSCWTVWHKAYPEIPKGNMNDDIEEQGPVQGWCQEIRLFAAAAKAAGKNLNRRSFVTALSQIKNFPGGYSPLLTYGPTKLYGPTPIPSSQAARELAPEQPVSDAARQPASPGGLLDAGPTLETSSSSRVTRSSGRDPAPVEPSAPFAPGSVSIRLYPHNGLPADQIVREFCAQAGLALGSGFDGIMASEHHGGFAGYMAQPLQMTSFALAEHATGWAAAAPLLLPLRSTALIAEEVAWLQARHRGRVGLGVAAGALPLDFEAAGVSQADSVDRFKSELPRIVAMLRGEELGDLDGDPALLACRQAPVPVLSAAVSVAAAVRAARCGAGILMEGMSAPARLARLTRAFGESEGTGSKMLIRRVWLGRIPAGLVEGQRAVYESYAAGTSSFGEDQTIASDAPHEMAERLAATVAEVGADALNLRVQLPGMSPTQVREQIEEIGSTVIGPLKNMWPS